MRFKKWQYELALKILTDPKWRDKTESHFQDSAQGADTGERSEGCQVEPIVRRCASHQEQSGETAGQPAIRRCEGEQEHPIIKVDIPFLEQLAKRQDGSEPAPANPRGLVVAHETNKEDGHGK